MNRAGSARLLVRYCNHDLDQFGDWRLASPWGEARISIFNSLPPSHPRDAYTEVWLFTPKPAEPDTKPHTDRGQRR